MKDLLKENICLGWEEMSPLSMFKSIFNSHHKSWFLFLSGYNTTWINEERHVWYALYLREENWEWPWYERKKRDGRRNNADVENLLKATDMISPSDGSQTRSRWDAEILERFSQNEAPFSLNEYDELHYRTRGMPRATWYHLTIENLNKGPRLPGRKCQCIARDVLHATTWLRGLMVLHWSL